jgi:hypothetical protein
VEIKWWITSLRTVQAANMILQNRNIKIVLKWWITSLRTVQAANMILQNRDIKIVLAISTMKAETNQSCYDCTAI